MKVVWLKRMRSRKTRKRRQHKSGGKDKPVSRNYIEDLVVRSEDLKGRGKKKQFRNKG